MKALNTQFIKASDCTTAARANSKPGQWQIINNLTIIIFDKTHETCKIKKKGKVLGENIVIKKKHLPGNKNTGLIGSTPFNYFQKCSRTGMKT